MKPSQTLDARSYTSQYSEQLDLFVKQFTQESRLITLSFAPSSKIPDNVFLPHRLQACEKINQPSWYQLEALATTIHIPLEEILGSPVVIRLATDDGGVRRITGVVTRVEQKNGDGGFVPYILTIESHLAVLQKRKNYRIFKDKTALEIVLAILYEHQQKSPLFRGSISVRNECRNPQQYLKRSFSMQYGETDFDYIMRLLARDRISFLLAPGKETASNSHTTELIFFNHPYSLPWDASLAVRFHRADATEKRDTITAWNGTRQMVETSATRISWNHTTMDLFKNRIGSAHDQGCAWNMESFDFHSDENLDPHHNEAFTRGMAQATDLEAKVFSGEGTVRIFTAGTSFMLEGHPLHDMDQPSDRTFTITQVEFQARNLLPTGLPDALKSLLGGPLDKDAPVFRCAFQAVRRGTPIVPPDVKPPRAEPMTARVVASQEGAPYTNELGKIKVEFPFTRPEDHEGMAQPDGVIPSAWIRYASPWACNGYGALFLPRKDSEVIIAFLSGDPDSPVAIASVYNQGNSPARFAHASSLSYDAFLSGFQTKMFQGTLSNALIFDDSTNQIKAHLGSDHAKSSLDLGFLSTHRSQNQITPLGEGAHLSTQGAAAVRGDKGVLITAEKSQAQLDRRALMDCLKNALALLEGMGEYAGQHNGFTPELEAGKTLQQALENWEQGTPTKPHTQRPADGQSLIALSAPDGLIAATPKTTAICAGENIDLSAQKHSHITVGQQLAIQAGKGASLFVQSGGLKAIANQGRTEVQAQNGPLSLLGEDVDIVAHKNEMLLHASKKITLMAGQSYITLGAEGIEIGSPSPLIFKTAKNVHQGGAGKQLPLPKVSVGPTQKGFQRVWEDTGEPMSGVPYQLVMKDGTLKTGVTDLKGHTEDLKDQGIEAVHATFGDKEA